MADRQYKDEAVLMLKSFRMHHDEPAYVICDHETEAHVAATLRDPKIVCIPRLDPANAASLKNGYRNDMAFDAAWHAVMMGKVVGMEEALERHPTVLYADCDVLFLAPVGEMLPSDCDVALSEHDIDAAAVAVNGRFNSGYIAVRNLAFTAWWREARRRGSFYDQDCLNEVPGLFRTNILPATHNFGWWRALCDGARGNQRLVSLAFRDGAIRLGDEPVVSIHTHLLASCWSHAANPYISHFNAAILNAMADSPDPGHRVLLAMIREKA